MTISSKLAVDFVKRYFDVFEFDSQPTKATTINAYHIQQAYVVVSCADIYPFNLDKNSTSCMLIFLPEKLKADKSTLGEMFKQIDNEDMDMRALVAGPNKGYRVTTNRLLVLEKLMQRSGLLFKTPSFSKTQQAVLNERISQLKETIRRNCNDLIQQLNSLTDMIKK